MKKLLISLFVLAFCTANMLFSQVYQWDWQIPNPPQSGVFWCSTFFLDSNNGWITSWSGQVLHTTDAGTTWILQETGTFNNLRSISFTDPDNGWIVGDGGLVMKTSDGGTNWESVTLGLNGTFNCIQFADANNGWFVGDGGKVQHTTDGGATWSSQLFGTTRNIYGISFVDVNNGWAAGSNGTMFKTTNGGSNWIYQLPQTTQDLKSVKFVDVNSGWAVGYNGTILHTSNGGMTWELQTSGAVQTLDNVFFLDAMNGWTAGEGGWVFGTNNGGATWTPLYTTTTSEIYSVYFTDINHGYIAGGYGTVGNSTDGGVNWNLLFPPPQTTNRASSIKFLNENLGWVSGDNGLILKTTNGGSNWVEKTSNTDQGLNSISFIDENNGWAVGYQGVVVRTTDGGETWASISLGSNAYFFGVHFVDANNGWLCGVNFDMDNVGCIYKTENGGESWVPQTTNSSDLIYSIYFIDANNGWATGYWNGSFLKTTDGGITWDINPLGFSSRSVYFTDINNGWLACGGGIILHSTDGGSNWVCKYQQQIGDIQELSNIKFLDTDNGWCVGGHGRVLRTTNGGNNWTDLSGIGFQYYVYDLYGLDLVNNNSVWIGGDVGQLLKGSFVPAIASPVLINPANISQNVSTMPQFQWGSVPEATSYKLQLSKNSNFSSLVLDKNVNGTTFTPSSPLEFNTIYFWRVNAISPLQTSPWSDTWSFKTTSFNWQVVTNTGNSSSIIVPTTINPTIGGRPFQTGDYIGLFYQVTPGNWACGGFATWTGNNLLITVWGDDDFTNIKDGFVVNEPYIFRVWDGIAQMEYPAIATYSEGPNNYQIDGISTLSGLSVLTPISQTFNLPSGWSMISGNVAVIQPNLYDIFSSVLDNIKLMKDGNGESFVHHHTILTR